MRKVSKDSVGHKEQETMLREYAGPLYTRLMDEGKPWTNEMIDRLLDGFLVKKLCYVGNDKCLMKVTNRTLNSVTDMLWKLSVNYDRKSVREYVPVKRISRGKMFCTRDLGIFEKATSDTGIANGAHLTSYLSKITNFPAPTIEEWLNTIAKTQEGFFRDEDKSTEARARKVHRGLKGNFDLAMAALGGRE